MPEERKKLVYTAAESRNHTKDSMFLLNPDIVLLQYTRPKPRRTYL